MPAKRYRVRLTAEERKELDGQVNREQGRRDARARILLMADEAQAGWCDAEIAKASHARSERVGAVCHSRDRSRPHAHATETETTTRRGEARLVQLACSAAPDGQEQWTLQLLADWSN